ncbi:non-hydrolyzing UDP-N-acetylglucosamine 2-epimerase [Pseudothermotoga thermarum]|uniref:UDP-N-acetylglucosamine 2-epimerase (non-hydrolyzing) n=1 Tax=Pseudothermotoga thermarum DSM 5069 TaxID=688269 RepID=F7YX13_9THEM|nr:UDP-N-acetylglucosamine 2-epimerase (non-hydrolyzing) [Pseudothermotoga thermarum]AEH50610.1 UDP-N-Acetylglucosamine 2-epimerase [Pseudothermotoga thermarum DSM 5069]
MKVAFVFGTRPEVIKVAPVYLHFKKMNENALVIATAQHREMMDMMTRVFKITPDYDMNIMVQNQSLNYVVSRVVTELEQILEKEKPDLVFVQGDTTTAFASALCAFHLSIPVAHIEAGLRTHNLYDPFPEELNRRLIDIMAEYLFAPTAVAKENLTKEGIEESRIYVVGNTVIDALEIIKNSVDLEKLRKELIDEVEYFLITLHRRENIGERMRSILKGIKRFVEESGLKAVFPVHKNPKVREIVKQELDGQPNFVLLEPVDYTHFLALLDGAKFIITDSGGIQEEAPSFGKFVVVARETTERPELVQHGLGILAGTCELSIYKALKEACSKKLEKVSNPFGDGKASQRIYEIVKQKLQKGGI